MLGRLINAEDILWLIRGYVLRGCWTGPKLPHAASDLLNRKFHFLETCWSPRKLPGPNQCQPAKLLGHENSEFAFPRLPSPDSRLPAPKKGFLIPAAASIPACSSWLR